MAAFFDPKAHPHRRYNPLKGEWVLVSPNRTKRPWMGHREEPGNNKAAVQNGHSTKTENLNPLLPGAVRSSGQVNPDYTSTFVFDNDFPALNDEEVVIPDFMNGHDKAHHDLFQVETVTGACRVMCYHPNPNMTMPLMSLEDVVGVVKKWKEEVAYMGKNHPWVQIFETKGKTMGCSNPHPHCQIWASSYMPNEPLLKDNNLKEYYERHGRPMLVDYVQKEIQSGERIVLQNDDWVVLVPFWALWPFETMILPKNPARNKQILRMTDLTEQEEITLADAIKRLTTRYDNLFNTSFPYVMGFHGAPTGQFLSEDESHWTLHAVFLPPLLQSASIRKFMGGYEMLAQVLRDITPEFSASKLRELPETHYLSKRNELGG